MTSNRGRQLKAYIGISLMLWCLYEIMWLPIDNLDEQVIYPSLLELSTDYIFCFMLTMCSIKFSRSIYKRNIFSVKKITNLPYFFSILSLFNLILIVPVTILQKTIFYDTQDLDWNWQDYFVNIFIFVILSDLFVSLYLLVLYARKLDESKKEKEHALRLAAETKVMALQSQVDPHFLFNSISTAISLASMHSEQTCEFLEHLADLYRYTSKQQIGRYSSVHEELENLHHYMELMKIRYGETVILKIDEQLKKSHTYILPSVFQLLVENAIKHNKASTKTPLYICIGIKENYYVVENDLRPKDQSTSSLGVGLANIDARYKALGNFEVLCEQHQNKYIVKIPIMDKPII